MSEIIVADLQTTLTEIELGVPAVVTIEALGPTGNVGEPVGGPSDAEDVAFTPSGSITATNVQAAVEEVAADAATATGLVASDVASVSSTVTALSSTVSTVSGGLTALTADVVTLDGDVTALDAEVTSLSDDLAAHVDATTGAHAASAIAFLPAGSISAENAQAAIEEVASDLATKADDAAVVKLTGTQTVQGVKTFLDPFQVSAADSSTIPFDRALDVVLQNLDDTDGNYMSIGLYTADGTIAGGITAQTIDHEAHTGRFVFSTRDGDGFSTKLTVDDAVHVPDATGDDHALNRQTGDARYALGTDLDALDDGLAAHIEDAAGAHAASAIAFLPAGGITADNVQDAIAEVAADAEAAFVPKAGSYSTTTDDVVTSAVSGDTENRFVLDADGTMYFGSGAGASDVYLSRESFGGFRVSATPGGSGTFQPLARFTGTHVGSGNGPQGLNFDPSFEPTASVSTLYGALINPRVRPATSIAVSSAAGFFVRVDTGSSGGSLSTLRAVQVAPPSYGTTLPTTANAVTIQNHGASGVGTARGLLVEQQSGAASNISAAIEASNTRTLWVSANADNTNAASGIHFGSSADTNLYRNGANSLRTDDKFTADLGFQANSGNYRLNGSTGPFWSAGSGSPEGSITAPVGSLWSRTDGGAGTSLYVKESGTGNTGWVAK